MCVCGNVDYSNLSGAMMTLKKIKSGIWWRPIGHKCIPKTESLVKVFFFFFLTHFGVDCVAMMKLGGENTRIAIGSVGLFEVISVASDKCLLP
jgi:hypothetical protein